MYCVFAVWRIVCKDTRSLLSDVELAPFRNLILPVFIFAIASRIISSGASYINAWNRVDRICFQISDVLIIKLQAALG